MGFSEKRTIAIKDELQSRLVRGKLDGGLRAVAPPASYGIFRNWLQEIRDKISLSGEGS